MFIKKFILSFGLLLISQLSLAGAVTCSSNASGDWDNPATWTNCDNGIPTVNNDVTIKDTHVVNLNIDTVELQGLIVETGGGLNVAERLVNPELGYTINLNQSAPKKVDVSNTQINLSAHLTINAKAQDIWLGGVVGPFDIQLNSDGETRLMGKIGEGTDNNSGNNPTGFVTDATGTTLFDIPDGSRNEPNFTVYGSRIFNDNVLIAQTASFYGGQGPIIFNGTINKNPFANVPDLIFNQLGSAILEFNQNIGEVNELRHLRVFNSNAATIKLNLSRIVNNQIISLPNIVLNSPTGTVLIENTTALNNVIIGLSGAYIRALNSDELIVNSPASGVVIRAPVGDNNQRLSSLTINTTGRISLSSPSITTISKQDYTGDVLLTNDVVLNSATAAFQNNIDSAGFDLTLNTTDTSGVTQIQGVLSGAGDLIKNGTGNLDFYSINTLTGNVVLNEGHLINKVASDSIFPNVPQLSLAANTTTVIPNTSSGDYVLGNNQSIIGNGLFAGNLIVQSGAMVSPGLSPGTLDVGEINMNSDSILSIEINGTTNNLEYDRLVLDQGGSLDSDSLGGAVLDLTMGFNANTGDVFKIIRSRTTRSGTFSGLPEGSEFIAGDDVLSISYDAGDGDDVELTVVGSAIMHVDASAAPGGDGQSWSAAFNNLQDALTVAASGNTIWVAQGVYYPDIGGGQADDDRTASFTLVDGVSIYGGFNGTETVLNQRNPALNITVLSGDISQDDVNSDGNHILEDHLDAVGLNSFHTIRGDAVDTSTVFSGFIVTAGQAEGTIDTDEVHGAGMYCGAQLGLPYISPTVNGPAITDSTFIGNSSSSSGAATFGCSQDVRESNFINNYSAGNAGAVSASGGFYDDVLFQGNKSQSNAGALLIIGGPISIFNSKFISNQMQGNGDGGAIWSSRPITLDNVLFSGNNSSGFGGAIYLLGPYTHNYTNVTMTGNKSSDGGGAIRMSTGPTLNLSNSIIWNNHDNTTDTTASSSILNEGGNYTQINSLVQNFGTSGVGNLDEDPLFITDTDPTTAPTADGNARLQFSSVAIDAGDNSFVTPGSMDLDKTDRIFNAVVDMGAYESSSNYTVSVNVIGLGAGSLVLQNKGTDDLSFENNGTQVFMTPVTQTDNYSVTVLSQPTSPNQECVVTNPTGTINGSDVTVDVNCTTLQYNVSVDVFGLADDVILSVLNNTETLDLTVNGTSFFPTPLDDGSAYAVSVTANPSTPNQICLITSGNASGTISGVDIEVTIQCTTNQYNVGVEVSGLASGNSVELTNNGESITVLTDGSVNFPTALADQSDYAVTVTNQPTSPNQICSVVSASGTLQGSDVLLTVTCTTDEYFVGGVAAGIASNNSLTLTLGVEDLIVNNNTAFVFLNPLVDESEYSVSVSTQPTSPNQSCDLINPAGTIAGDDVVDIQVNCTTNQYAIGGFVTGLHAGNNLVMQNNNGDDLIIMSDGFFEFNTPIDDQQPYDVSILNQPSDPIQTCTLSNASGQVAGEDVLTLVIECEFGDDLIFSDDFE